MPGMLLCQADHPTTPKYATTQHVLKTWTQVFSQSDSANTKSLVPFGHKSLTMGRIDWGSNMSHTHEINKKTCFVKQVLF